MKKLVLFCLLITAITINLTIIATTLPQTDNENNIPFVKTDESTYTVFKKISEPIQNHPKKSALAALSTLTGIQIFLNADFHQDKSQRKDKSQRNGYEDQWTLFIAHILMYTGFGLFYYIFNTPYENTKNDIFTTIIN